MAVLSQRLFKWLQKQDNLDYSKGYNSYLANDVVPENVLVYATDTRISTLGRQTTRQGCDPFSVPAGETINATESSTTGAGSQNIGLTTWLAAKYTASSNGRLTRVDLNIKNVAAATGPIIVEIRADASGSPGSLLAQSSIPASTPTGSYAYLTARFIEAPLQVTATSYWIVAYIQGDGTNTYAWSSTTNATSAKTSSNSGVSWSTSAFDLNYKTYVSTDGGTLGHFRAYKSDGTKVQLMAYKEVAGTTAVAKVDDVTGALTNIKTGLSSTATFYDFEQVQDVVYYVNGVDAPRRWDFTTEAVMGGSPAVATRIKWHKNHMFLLLAADPAQAIFSDTALPETFTSTNFLYIPAPKSNDPVVQWETLNDNLYFFTSRTKWALFGSDLSNITLRQAPGTKGTAAPDSVKRFRNHIYFASDDGFYRFNGSTDELLSEAITTEYRNAANRTTMGGGIANNRYYLSYTPAGGAQNSRTWVYNINYNSMESNDTGTYVQRMRSWNTTADSGQFIQASNLVGALYYGERSTNQYNNLGKNLSWEIRMKYDHYGQPASNKHIKRWYPRFATSGGNYTVFCQYDRDFLGSPTTQFVDLRGSGALWGGGTLWGTGTWGTTVLITPKLNIPGQARYIQHRYLRTGVNMPVEFLGDTVYYYVRRPR